VNLLWEQKQHGLGISWLKLQPSLPISLVEWSALNEADKITTKSNYLKYDENVKDVKFII